MKTTVRLLLWLLAFLWPLSRPWTAPQHSAADELGRWPVLHNGRIKPLDSVARTSLLLLRGKQSISGPEKLSAMDWLADVLFDRTAAAALPTFRVDHPQLLGLFGLEAGTKKYFSYNDLAPYLRAIQEQARSLPERTRDWSDYDRALNQLFGDLILYQQLAQTVHPLGEASSVDVFYRSTLAAPAAMQRVRLLQLEDMARSPLFLLPAEGGWITPGTALREAWRGVIPPPALFLLADLAAARQSGNEAAFRQSVQSLLATAPVIHEGHPDLEYIFQQAQPFGVAMPLYILVLLLVFLGWQFNPSFFLRPAFDILWVTFLLHTAGIVLRVIITGYAPVTNLYSSAVVVGWVAVLLSLLFESMQKNGIGSLAASTVGFLTLLVAQHLQDGGDTMEKMRAVLNSNFWLWTHVIAITLGYGATFLAGFLGLIYIFYGWLRGMNKDLQTSFHRMLYGAVCFSLLFSFLGTVLGGIWADQSWGRFWGWDPKENGALMICLFTALILHALRDGLIRTRGLAHLSILGNCITAWSWFGTNMLGVGLHSYGFMDSAFFWLLLFWLSQFMVMLLEWWRPVKILPSSHE